MELFGNWVRGLICRIGHHKWVYSTEQNTVHNSKGIPIYFKTEIRSCQACPHTEERRSILPYYVGVAWVVTKTKAGDKVLYTPLGVD